MTGSAATREDVSDVRRDAAVLRVTGPLDRAAVPAFWRALPADLAGVEAIDIAAVPHVDSAGLALLAELQARAGGRLAIRGAPEGLQGLRAAYRLTDKITF